MARLRRKNRTETFSVSVSPETKALLRRAADRSFGGNVSAVIEAIALEANRQEALDWLLQRAAPVEDATYRAFLDEMTGSRKKRRRAA